MQNSAKRIQNANIPNAERIIRVTFISPHVFFQKLSLSQQSCLFTFFTEERDGLYAAWQHSVDTSLEISSQVGLSKDIPKQYVSVSVPDFRILAFTLKIIVKKTFPYFLSTSLVPVYLSSVPVYFTPVPLFCPCPTSLSPCLPLG